MILLGMFVPDKNFSTTIFFISGVVIAITVLIKTANALNWSFGDWWVQNWSSIIGVIVILAIISAIVASSKPEEKAHSKFIKNILGGD
jgi:NADH:ubiquinone oxidoreductase subunit 2 (subunit N)